MSKPTWSVDFPRLYELYSESDTISKVNYFALPKFQNAVNITDTRTQYEDELIQYKRLEKDLQQLDGNAWRKLKQKAVKYVAIINKHREHEQLFNTLSEVKGYLYLKSEGCTEVRFISEENTQTPDLYGRHGNSRILMEVKTINRSDDERDWIRANSEINVDGIRHMTARGVRTGLSDVFKDKIRGTIDTAKRQLMSYRCNGVQRKIVYLVISPDLSVALDSRSIEELEAFIGEQGNSNVEVEHCFRGWKT